MIGPCSFCGGKMRAVSPIEREPSFRCNACNVRITVGNQSYLPDKVRRHYWWLVLSHKLSRQEQYIERLKS